MQKVAHLKAGDSNRFHALQEHLEKTAILAKEFAERFHADEWAYIAGIWHDLGKYSDAFQHYIRTANDPDAQIEQRVRIDHSTAGAAYALKTLGPLGKILAYLIAGHHAGLPDADSVNAGTSCLDVRLSNAEDKLAAALCGIEDQRILKAQLPKQKPLGGSEGFHLWVRMLYSCLVDADFLDTEAFMDEGRAASRGVSIEVTTLKTVFDAHMEEMMLKAPKTPLNTIRAEVLRQCKEAAKLEAGLFSLTVPTGGGKTLSSLAFALEHARILGKERIIYAIPYTSIIEQTAAIFKNIFKDLPEGAVIEVSPGISAGCGLKL